MESSESSATSFGLAIARTFGHCNGHFFERDGPRSWCQKMQGHLPQSLVRVVDTDQFFLSESRPIIGEGRNTMIGRGRSAQRRMKRANGSSRLSLPCLTGDSALPPFTAKAKGSDQIVDHNYHPLSFSFISNNWDTVKSRKHKQSLQEWLLILNSLVHDYKGRLRRLYSAKLVQNKNINETGQCHLLKMSSAWEVDWFACQSRSSLADVALLPSQATIFTLSTFTNSLVSRNSTSFNTKVHTLSQNR